MTMQEIFALENRLSVGHVLAIRNSLGTSATPMDYLNALVEAVAASTKAMEKIRNN